MTDTTYTAEILAHRLDALKSAVAKLAKLAAKVDAPAPEVVVTDRIEKTITQDEKTTTEVWLQVTILNAYPVLSGGWRFVAAIDHIADGVNIVRVAPDYREMDLSHLATVASSCDHCRQTRQRFRTFYFVNEDGDTVQVGSTCMTDFTGHEVKFRWIEFMDELTDNDELFGRSGGSAIRFSVIDLLTAAARLIGVYGFQSAASAIPTKSLLGSLLRSPRDFEDVPPLTDEQAQEVKDAVEWILTAEADSSYLQNLQTVVKYDLSDYKYHGLIASLLTAYRRHMGWLAERKAREAADTAPKAPVVVGDKVQISGTVVTVGIKETDWGYRDVMTVLDDRGFKVWGTCPAKIRDASTGDKVSFIASVEKAWNDEFFGYFKRPSKVTIEYVNNPVH